jgi:hypothetical protein
MPRPRSGLRAYLREALKLLAFIAAVWAVWWLVRRG